MVFIKRQKTKTNKIKDYVNYVKSAMDRIRSGGMLDFIYSVMLMVNCLGFIVLKHSGIIL